MSHTSTKKALPVLALLLACFAVGAAQQAPPGIVLRPLPASTPVANQGQANPPPQPVDPRLRQVGRWLRTQVGNLPASGAAKPAVAPPGGAGPKGFRCAEWSCQRRTWAQGMSLGPTALVG